MAEQSRPIVRSAFALVTMAAGLALLFGAVVRWRQLSWSELVWLAAFVVMFAIRSPYAAASARNAVARSRTDGLERVLLGAMFATMMLVPLLDLATNVFAFADYRLPLWASLAGAVVQPPCLWLFWRSHADLGRNWSPGLEVREEHGLVTRGVYARVRHPMYAAIWISVLAQPLLLHNWISGFLVVPAFAAMWLLRVPKEEAMMRERFGAAYDVYAARTGRLLPWLRGREKAGG